MGVQVLFGNDLTVMLNEIDKYIKNFGFYGDWCIQMTKLITYKIKFVVVKGMDHYCFLKIELQCPSFETIVSWMENSINMRFGIGMQTVSTVCI
ncbi:MAG: hypothetical protein ETSY1_38205 [Candidatus Entotheonella factor]|uniref:Uncharacterized protein n=1 Tax=Entotheonella factor TaxID=1429438 RepID=W4L8J4_ENTF1|nr:MAG: hypothetical protein ETSY1_38205 [Candidatus Entotheonella factor]